MHIASVVPSFKPHSLMSTLFSSRLTFAEVSPVAGAEMQVHILRRRYILPLPCLYTEAEIDKLTFRCPFEMGFRLLSSDGLLDCCHIYLITKDDSFTMLDVTRTSSDGGNRKPISTGTSQRQVCVTSGEIRAIW